MRRNGLRFQADRYQLLKVAKGQEPADLFIRNGNIVNVYSGEILKANVAICRDRIAYVGPSEAALGENTLVLDAHDQYLAPGFIEPHTHPWVVYNPVSLTGKVLPLGTTTMAHDNLFFYLHLGKAGFAKLVQDLCVLPGLHFWLVRLVSQADYEGEREDFSPEAIQSLLELEDVIGTAEVTRWPILYRGDPFAIETMEYAKQLGKISDGHTSGCSYDRLNSIVAAGVSACHEAVTVQEVLDRLRLGMWTTLRNSSLRPDLSEIVKAITEYGVHTSRMLMTTDGPHPAFIEEHGFVDGLLRTAVAAGVPAMQAVQMVTVNAATYLGLDEMIGGLAPGRRADVVLLPDLHTFRPDLVVAGGQVVARHGELTASMPLIDWQSYPENKPILLSSRAVERSRLYVFRVDDRFSRVAEIPVLRFEIAVITSRQNQVLPVQDGYVDISGHPGLVYAALIDRAGDWVSHAIIDNFLGNVEGMASTYNTTTHVLVLGRDPEAMATAVRRVEAMRGGVAMVENGRPIVEIPLPFTGMMTTSPSFSTASSYQDELLKAVQERGYPFHDILYSLLFLTCDFLPGLRLTPRGLIDVKTLAVLHEPVRLRGNSI